MRTKILYLCDSLCLGGAEKVLVDVLCSLDHSRFETQVLMLRNENAFAYLTDTLPVAIRSLNMQRTNPRSWSDIRKLYGGLAAIEKFHPHIIHTQGQDADLYGQFISLLKNYKIITTLHLEDTFRYDKTRASRLYRLKMLLENITVQRCNKVIAISENMRTYALKCRNVFFEKIEVVRNAITPLKRTRDKLLAKKNFFGNDEMPVLGFAGRLAAQKNLFTALDAFAELKKGFPEARFVLVGDGPQRKQLEKYAMSRDIAGSVHFVGAQNNVAAFYEMFDVFVLPSFTEGLPLALLEAMSLNVPVVVSAVGGIPELIRHEYSGILLHPPDRKMFNDAVGDSSDEPLIDEAQSKELADSLTSLLGDKEFAARLANNAFETFRRECSMDVNIKKLEDIYRHVIARKPVRQEEALL